MYDFYGSSVEKPNENDNLFCVKTITVTLDDRDYKRAQTVAEQNSKSVSDLFSEWLASLPDSPSQAAGMSKEERDLIERIRNKHSGFNLKENLSREALHNGDGVY